MSDPKTIVDDDFAWAKPVRRDPTFEVVTDFADGDPAGHPVRRNWRPTIDALAAGKALYMLDEELTESHIKYLALAMRRRGKGERLHVQRERRAGKLGRILWVEKEPE